MSIEERRKQREARKQQQASIEVEKEPNVEKSGFFSVAVGEFLYMLGYFCYTFGRVGLAEKLGYLVDDMKQEEEPETTPQPPTADPLAQGKARLEGLKSQFAQRQSSREQRRLQMEIEMQEKENLRLLQQSLPLFDVEEIPQSESEVEVHQLPTVIEPIRGVEEEEGGTNHQPNEAPSLVHSYTLQDTYNLPPIALLEEIDEEVEISEEEVQEMKETLQGTLDSFAIDAQVKGAVVGPRVTLMEVYPARGVKVESIATISNNIAMDLCASSLRILAPVPGKPFVGIEVPNRKSVLIGIREFVESPRWHATSDAIPLVLGKSISGDDMYLDLNKAPHLLIAGATGSGKSVCLNSILLSLLYRFSPADLRLVLVDPKVVEFSIYNSLPHLVVPVITEAEKVPPVLHWVIHEMEARYKILSKVGVRNIEGYNSRTVKSDEFDDAGNPLPKKLPFLVVIIDELADIMMTSKQDVEVSLARIAQLSRAVGIHTIIATQRPSVNVITGIIKANFPTRIAFQVTSVVDSRTILDSKGAESLLGRGDMLFNPPGASQLQRIQGPYMGDDEINSIVEFVSGQATQHFKMEIFETDTKQQQIQAELDIDQRTTLSPEDELLVSRAQEIVVESRRASISYVQRNLRIGYNRAAMIMEVLEERGVVGPQIGQNPREIFLENC